MLKTTLEDAKDRLDALLTYANGVTGESDTSIGDAIGTLCAKYDDHTIEDALIQNTAMDEYYNDRVTSVFGEYRFQKTNFKIIRLPNVTSTVGNYNFHGGGVSLLEELYLPKIVTSGWNSYLNNPNLRIADIGKTFGGGKITGCPNLEILIIRDTNMKAVGNTWLTGSKLASDGTGGYVYVPQALLSQYQASQSWADYANVLEFRSIEGSIYE